MLRSLSWFLLLSLFALTAPAGTNRWTIHGPDGGTVHDLELDPDDPSIV